MSNVVSKSDPLTSSEITMIENLAALSASGIGQFIRKTGTNTFENASISSSGIVPLTTVSPINDSNTVFVFATAPTFLIINGKFYMQTGGEITWTGTTTVTLSYPVGLNGTIFGI